MTRNALLTLFIILAGCHDSTPDTTGSAGAAGSQVPTAGAPAPTAGAPELAMCDTSAIKITALSNGVYNDANCDIIVSMITVNDRTADTYTTNLQAAAVQKGAINVVTTQLVGTTKVTFIEPGGNSDVVFVQTDRPSGFLVAAATWPQLSTGDNQARDQQIYSQLFTFFQNQIALRFPAKR
jgi:hypothetical protein